MSRVLVIRGPSTLSTLNRDNLEAFLRKIQYYQTADIIDRATTAQTYDNMATLEWHFGIYRAQAKAAKLLLILTYKRR